MVVVLALLVATLALVVVIHRNFRVLVSENIIPTTIPYWQTYSLLMMAPAVAVVLLLSTMVLIAQGIHWFSCGLVAFFALIFFGISAYTAWYLWKEIRAYVTPRA